MLGLKAIMAYESLLKHKRTKAEVEYSLEINGTATATRVANAGKLSIC